VTIGRLPQGPGPFAGNERLLDAFLAESGLAREPARTLLAKFRLGADCVHRRCETLSPGERSRAGLALLAARGVNSLALDEPTNHLDLPAIEELEQALDGFEGAVLLVTHDRRLLERFAATLTVAL
jgi:ATPase subunit of ABC transporter with duplicated ATPase domains